MKSSYLCFWFVLVLACSLGEATIECYDCTGRCVTLFSSPSKTSCRQNSCMTTTTSETKSVMRGCGAGNFSGCELRIINGVKSKYCECSTPLCNMDIDGIECYNCELTDDCEDPHYSSSKTRCPLNSCMKTTATNLLLGHKYVKRGCGDGNYNGCQESSPWPGIKDHDCECTTALCNTAATVSHSGLQRTIGLTVAALAAVCRYYV